MKKKVKSSSLDFEITFYERLVKDNPYFIDALIPLADAYTKVGKFKKGLAIDKKLARLKQHDPMIFYNLACSYSLLNMAREAFKALRKAISLGYADLRYLQHDPDLEYIHQDSQFKEIEKLIKKRESLPKKRY